MNPLLLAQFVLDLAGIVAREKGVAPRELAYLSLITKGVDAFSMTDTDLTELKAKYEHEVAAGVPVSPEELEAIADRIKGRSERIQNA